MSKWLSDQLEQAIVLRWLIVKIALKSVITLGVALQSILANVTYSSLDTQGKLNVFLSILILWGNDIYGFLDTTVASIMKGKIPIGDPKDQDTMRFTKTEQTTITTEKDKNK